MLLCRCLWHTCGRCRRPAHAATVRVLTHNTAQGCASADVCCAWQGDVPRRGPSTLTESPLRPTTPQPQRRRRAALATWHRRPTRRRSLPRAASSSSARGEGQRGPGASRCCASRPQTPSPRSSRRVVLRCYGLSSVFVRIHAVCCFLQVEVSHALVGELLDTLRHAWRDLADDSGHAAASAVALLRGVAGAGRFALTARLLSRAAREHAAALLAELDAELRAVPDGADAAEQLAALRRAYGVA